MDALLAVAILVVGIFTFYNMIPSEKSIEQSYILSNDFLNIMSVLKISEINNSYIQDLIDDGNITNLNNTILQQVGELWAKNRTGLAGNIIENISAELIPKNIKFGVWIENETIYTSESVGNPLNLISSNRMVSGITKFKPLFGFLSRLFLTNIDEKLINSYYYFGGYVGDGNLSARFVLPDAFSNVTQVYLEIAVNHSFELYINGNYSGNYSPQYSDDMRSSKWNISSSYYDNFMTGNNTFSFDFGSELGAIGGGFVRVDTLSNQTNFTEVEYDGVTATKREYLPGIHGVLNLYSSFYVPGDLSSLKMHLHFDTQDNTTLRVGGTQVYRDNPGGETTIDLTDADFTNLTYSEISKKTIPLRFRLDGSDFVGPGVDSALVTDVSGSMDQCSGIYYNATVCKYEYCCSN